MRTIVTLAITFYVPGTFLNDSHVLTHFKPQKFNEILILAPFYMNQLQQRNF